MRRGCVASLVLMRTCMAPARSHEELVAWQLAHELKLGVYALIRSGPVARDVEFRDQLRRSARSAPRLIAEGFGRFRPADFSKYLRWANGELKETFDTLRDGIDSGYFTLDQVLPLQRLSKRASKASTSLIAYLQTAKPPEAKWHPKNPRNAVTPEKARNPQNAKNPVNPVNETPEPSEPSEPPEPFKP